MECYICNLQSQQNENASMKRKFYLSHFDDGEKERIFPSTNYGAFAAITKTGWLYTSRHLDQIGWPAQTAESTWTSLSNNAPEAESIADAFAFGAQPGIVSQGDRAMGTDLARAQYGFDGSGITVGVISDSFDKYGAFASDRASGELPWDTRILREGEWGNDEGRAMAQIIHDVAPGASILFAAGGRTMADMAQAIRDLAAAGAKVIVDDLFYQAEPTYQDSIINNARAATRLARTMTGRAGFLIIEACAGDRVPSVAECSETREHEAQSDLAWTTVGRMISPANPAPPFARPTPAPTTYISPGRLSACATRRSWRPPRAGRCRWITWRMGGWKRPCRW